MGEIFVNVSEFERQVYLKETQLSIKGRKYFGRSRVNPPLAGSISQRKPLEPDIYRSDYSPLTVSICRSGWQ